MIMIKNADDVAKSGDWFKPGGKEELALIQRGTHIAHDISKMLREQRFDVGDDMLVIVQVLLDAYYRHGITIDARAIALFAKHVAMCPARYEFD